MAQSVGKVAQRLGVEPQFILRNDIALIHFNSAFAGGGHSDHEAGLMLFSSWSKSVTDAAGDYWNDKIEWPIGYWLDICAWRLNPSGFRKDSLAILGRVKKAAPDFTSTSSFLRIKIATIHRVPTIFGINDRIDTHIRRWSVPYVFQVEFNRVDPSYSLINGVISRWFDIFNCEPRTLFVLHHDQLLIRQTSLPSSYASIGDDGNHPSKRDIKHSWIVGPAAFVAGVFILGCRWWWLGNNSSWWPDDRRNVAFGMPLFLVGASLIFWAVYHLF